MRAMGPKSQYRYHHTRYDRGDHECHHGIPVPTSRVSQEVEPASGNDNKGGEKAECGPRPNNDFTGIGFWILISRLA